MNAKATEPPVLHMTSMIYPEQAELDWHRSCAMLTDSQVACDYLKKILQGKVSRRGKPTRRFFGEAYVATQIPHTEGYYASFQWLRSPQFLTTRPFRPGPTQTFQEQYRAALRRHFKNQLEVLQRNASAIHEEAGVMPSAPDLWLIEPSGRHRFIEVKLPTDDVNYGQLAGLAAIAASFHNARGLAVEVIDLRPNSQARFKLFVDILAAQDIPRL